jgi:hypothetical protein
MKRVSVLLLFTLAMLAFTTASFADSGDDSSIIIDEESLFGEAVDTGDGGSAQPVEEATGEDPSFEEDLFGEAGDSDTSFITEGTSTSGIASALLVSEGVELGGRYSLTASSAWEWDDPASLVKDLTDPEIDSADVDTSATDSAAVDLSATLFFDARPSEDFRVFGKTSITHPFDDDGGVRAFNEVFHIDELFSDFTWNDTLFFRGGKHTINWGVGRFFSPADLLNVTEIDPEDPEADREGPVSLKIQFPFSAHNAYLYGIANNVTAPDEFGVAGKVELVLAGMEFGIGGIYQKDIAPSGMLTVSAPIGDVDVFAEAVLRYGSDRTFVTEGDTLMTPYDLVTYDEKLFFNATLGFSFIYTFEEVDSSVNLTGQYLYNGEGYDDRSVLNDYLGYAIFKTLGDPDFDIGLSISDMMNTGMHYSALAGGWNNIFESDFSLQVFWMHNYSDASGWLSPSLSVALFDELSISLKTPYTYGDPGDEYAPAGESLSIQISANLGGGRY